MKKLYPLAVIIILCMDGARRRPDAELCAEKLLHYTPVARSLIAD